MRRQRGSAMLFAVVLVGMMTVAILAYVQLTTSAAVVESRREAGARSRYSFEGAVQRFVTDLKMQTVTLPCTKSYIVGDHTVDLTAYDNSTAVARTVFVKGTVKVQGGNFSYERVVGNRAKPHPFYYAVFSNTNFDPTQSFTLGVNDTLGDLMVNGSIVPRSNPFVINGDLESVGATLPVGAVIKGNVMRQASSVSLPIYNKLDYALNALLTIVVNTLTSLDFANGLLPKLVYKLGNLTISGLITGQGTLFVDGDVTIKDNVTMANGSARIVVIATGKIKMDNSVTQVAGFYMSGNDFETPNGPLTLTGSIAANRLVLKGPLTVIHDPYFWDNPSEASKYKLPGFWP